MSAEYSAEFCSQLSKAYDNPIAIFSQIYLPLEIVTTENPDFKVSVLLVACRHAKLASFFYIYIIVSESQFIPFCSTVNILTTLSIH